MDDDKNSNDGNGIAPNENNNLQTPDVSTPQNTGTNINQQNSPAEPSVMQSPQVAQPQQGASLEAHQKTTAPQPASVGSSGETKTYKKSKKLLLPIVVGALLLLGGAAAAYNSLVLNSSSGIWNTALSRTSGGFESILSAVEAEPPKGGAVEGSFSLKSPTVVDGNISGTWYDSSLQVSGDIGLFGLRPKAEVRAVPATEGQSPDIYIKVSDIEGLGALLGIGNPQLSEVISEINNNWFVVDHTLYEQALLSDNEDVPELSSEELSQINEALLTVINNRLFTDDEANAVVIAEEALGEEDFKGASTYKYRLKVQKQQLVDFVTELKEALEETSLSELLLNDSSAESFEEAIDFDSLLDEVKNADLDSFSAEAWVDKELKYIRNIRITPTGELPENESGYIDFYLPYDGGDVFPFTISVNSENSDTGAENNLTAQMSINRESLATDLSLDINAEDSGQSIIGSANLSVTPSDNEIEVEVPNNPKNIFELFGFLTGAPNVPTEPFPSDTLGDVDFRNLFGNPNELNDEMVPLL